MLYRLYSVVVFLFLVGFSATGECSEIQYQPGQILAKGTKINDDKGLYRLTVTDDGYFAVKIDDVLELICIDSDAYRKGNYYVQTFPIGKIPVQAQKDLRKSFDWINEKVIMKRARKKAQVILVKERYFKGAKALYLESSFPGKTSKGVANLTVIHNHGFAYTNLVFFNKDHLFWVYYSLPETEVDFIPKPRITDDMKNRFEQFLEGITLI